MKNNTIEPEWLKRSIWFADSFKGEKDIIYPDYMSGRETSSTLIYKDLGDWEFPSGKMFLDSLITDFDRYYTEDKKFKHPQFDHFSPLINVPKTKFKMSLITASETHEVADFNDMSKLITKVKQNNAYLSFRWDSSDTKAKVKRVVIPRTTKNPSQFGPFTGAFFVNKSVLGVFDLDSFQSQFSQLDVFHSFVDKKITELNAVNSSKDPKKTDFLVDSKNNAIIIHAFAGVAVVVAEVNTEDELLALHIDFGNLHSFGEDCEYDVDWDFLNDKIEALRKKYKFYYEK